MFNPTVGIEDSRKCRISMPPNIFVKAGNEVIMWVMLTKKVRRAVVVDRHDRTMRHSVPTYIYRPFVGLVSWPVMLVYEIYVTLIWLTSIQIFPFFLIIIIFYFFTLSRVVLLVKLTINAHLCKISVVKK